MDSHRIALTPTVARQTPRNEFGNVLKSALQQAASVGGVALASIPGGGLLSAAISQVTSLTSLPGSTSTAVTGVTTVNAGQPLGAVASSPGGLPPAMGGMIEQMRVEADRSMLMQLQLQQESREYNTVSNILKVRHDSAKAAINNIR